MPKLKHTKACTQCPYRKDSWPGWLGSGTPESFAHGAVADHLDEEFPCHVAINYEEPDWKTKQYPDAPLCAGALAMCANNCKRPHDPERAALVREVGQDPEVFAWPHEFIAHHKEGHEKTQAFLESMKTKPYEPMMMTEDELDVLLCTCSHAASDHYDYTDGCDECGCDEFEPAD